MSEEETFQGFSLILPARKQELWRWLYADLLGAVFDEPLKPGNRTSSTRSSGKQYL